MTPSPPDAPLVDKRRRGLKGVLILDTVATLILAPIALFWGMMSAMATTTTDDAAFANAYVMVNMTLPAAMVICLIGGWVAWARRRDGLVWPIILLPLIWLVVSIAMMANWPD